MRKKRKDWILAGRPRGDVFIVYREYKEAKRVFRRMHRLASTKYIQQINADIDNAAGIESPLFWRLFNSKQKQTQNMSNEIKFEHSVFRNSSEICHEWGAHFANLYSDTDSESYDQTHCDYVTQCVSRIDSEATVVNDDHISEDEVSSALLSLNFGKMCGVDNVSNEHLIHGGLLLKHHLTFLFDLMYCFNHVPTALKRGLILTLYKGGGKPKNEANSYRAITLSSSILKLFEKVLLGRLQTSINKPLHDLQGGFQPNMGSPMTSFILTESISYCKDKHSKLFTCFLDARQSFDRVWHDGLIFKLHNLGICTKLLKVVISMHRDMFSKVMYKGYFSHWFPVLQGTRQGGVWSPFLYLVYIDALICELVCSNFGFQIEGLSLCAPSFADDMALLSLSCKALQKMINICFNYSKLWRFQYNPTKCSVVVFNETKRSFQKRSRSWVIGTYEIMELEKVNHLGIFL